MSEREITIEEMPQGCVLFDGTNTICIASPSDASAIIESLQRMIAALETKPRTRLSGFVCYLFGHTWRPWQGDFFEPYCVRCGHKPGLAQILRDARK